MGIEFKQNIKVLSSQTDMNIEMGIVQSIALIQDNMCEFFKNVHCDGMTLIPTHNCFFVVTKTKVHFDRFAKWLDLVEMTTDVSSLSRISVNLKTDFVDVNRKEKFVSCVQEMCAMDNDSRRVRLLNTTPFPNVNDESGVREKVFSKFSQEFDIEDLVREVKVDSMNIDIYQHTNNVEYVRLMMSVLDKKFFLDKRITDFEIHYVSESKYGDVLQIYKKELSDGIYFEIRNDDRVVTKALVEYIDR